MRTEVLSIKYHSERDVEYNAQAKIMTHNIQNALHIYSYILKV